MYTQTKSYLRNRTANSQRATRNRAASFLPELGKKLGYAVPAAIAANNVPQRPNIVLMYEDDWRWEESFAKSHDKLAALVARAKEQVQSGQFRAAGFDEL